MSGIRSETYGWVSVRTEPILAVVGDGTAPDPGGGSGPPPGDPGSLPPGDPGIPPPPDPSWPTGDAFFDRVVAAIEDTESRFGTGDPLYESLVSVRSLLLSHTVQGEPLFHRVLPDLDEMELQASRSPFPPVVSLRRFWVLRSPTLSPRQLAAHLNVLDPAIEEAWPQVRVSPALVDPDDDLDSSLQDYLEAGDKGINARYAWSGAEVDGDGVGFAWIDNAVTGHSQLPEVQEKYNETEGGVASGEDHGVAILGVVCAKDDQEQIVGIAPGCRKPILFYGAQSSIGTAEALSRAAQDLHNGNGLLPGDVLLVAVQAPAGSTSVEEHSEIFSSIRLLVGLGAVVVECAGNKGHDIDPVLNGGKGQFDSGAIIVAASDPWDGHSRAGVSNFGSRIDCFASGNRVVTLNADSPSHILEDFAGTSAAGAIVAGAAILTQQMAEKAFGRRLSPWRMRRVLSKAAFGTSRLDDKIGVMPDLEKIWKHGLGQMPELVIRDNLSDDGSVPTVGGLSASPDIYVMPADWVVSWPFNAVPPAKVEGYVDHKVVLRIQNQGAGNPEGVSAKVYWSLPATLVHPGEWNLIGSTVRASGLAVTDGLVEMVPIPWSKESLPPLGHYCFVALIDHPDDAAPPVPDFYDDSVELDLDVDAADLWRDFVRNNNNVAWRNFNVEEMPGDGAFSGVFFVTALPDRGRDYGIRVVTTGFPEGARLQLDLPTPLLKRYRTRGSIVPILLGELPRRTEEWDGPKWVAESWETRRLSLSGGAVDLGNFLLDPGARYPCRLVLSGLPPHGGEGSEAGEDPDPFEVAVVQTVRSQEVGRITWGFEARGRRPDGG